MSQQLPSRKRRKRAATSRPPFHRPLFFVTSLFLQSRERRSEQRTGLSKGRGDEKTQLPSERRSRSLPRWGFAFSLTERNARKVQKLLKPSQASRKITSSRCRRRRWIGHGARRSSSKIVCNEFADLLEGCVRKFQVGRDTSVVLEGGTKRGEI